MRYRCKYNLGLLVPALLFLRPMALPVQLVYLTLVPLEALEGPTLRQEAWGKLLFALIHLR
jgi:hypothetical protein